MTPHPRKSKDTQIDNYPFKFKILAGNADGTDYKTSGSLLDLPTIEAKEATEPVFTLVLHTELLRQLVMTKPLYAFTMATQTVDKMQ